MGVAKESETDDMLVPVGEGLESRSPSTKAIVCRDMPQEDSLFSLGLHIFQNLLEPGELITWVREDLPQVPIHVIASLSGHSKYPSVVE